MTRCTITSCSRPAAGGFVCPPCARKLDRALEGAPFVVDELLTVLTRQARYGSGGGSRQVGGALPLTFDVGGSNALARLDRVLSAAVDALLAYRPVRVPAGPSCPLCGHPTCSAIRSRSWVRPNVRRQDRGHRVLASSRWLGARVGDLRHHVDGGVHVEAILSAFRSASGAIDRPPDRWFAGPCNAELDATDDKPARMCGTDLYAEVGGVQVKCRACGALYDVRVRRDWLLEAADDHLAPASEISRAVSWLGADPLTPARVRQWAARGRIKAKTTIRCRVCIAQKRPDPCSRCSPLYRVGDAIDLLAQSTEKASS